MQSETQKPEFIALSIILGLLLVSGFLIFQRGGVLAWTGGLAALLLFAKHARRPARTDRQLAFGVVVALAASWAVTWSYVRAGWESGEVVEIDVQLSDGMHKARVWVLDLDGEPVVYYDAPPNVAERLLAGAPMTLTRDGRRTEGCADASRVDALPEEEVAAALAVMDEKYREHGLATDLFYVVLGGQRDRIGVLVRVNACS